MAAGNSPAVVDELVLENRAGEIADAIRPDTFIEDPERLEVLEMLDPSVYRCIHRPSDLRCQALTPAGAPNALCGIAEAELPGLRKQEQFLCFSEVRAPAITAGSGEQKEDAVEVLDELLVSFTPVSGRGLEDEEGIDE